MSHPVVLYFTIVAIVSIVIMFITSNYIKLSWFKRGLLLSGIFLFIVFVLPIVSSYFRFDILYGGDHLYSSSSTRGESIKRGVFVCDLRLSPSPFSLNDSMSIEITQAWIEKTWRRSYWFWTTLPGSSDYHITIIAPEVKGNWIIRNNSRSGFGQDVLGYYDGEFSGSIGSLPASDTLRYYILKRNEFNFDDENIIGEIKFVLEKP